MDAVFVVIIFVSFVLTWALFQRANSSGDASK